MKILSYQSRHVFPGELKPRHETNTNSSLSGSSTISVLTFGQVYTKLLRFSNQAQSWLSAKWKNTALDNIIDTNTDALLSVIW